MTCRGDSESTEEYLNSEEYSSSSEEGLVQRVQQAPIFQRFRTCEDYGWLVTWLLSGMAAGFVEVKCLIAYPKVLADQFVFQNFAVLKMFIGAVGTSLLVQAIFCRFAPETFDMSRGRAKRSYGFGRVIFGLIILGIGLAVAGSGPTMVAPGLGARVKTAWGLLVGGLLAAALVGVVDKFFAAKEMSFLLNAKPLMGGKNEAPVMIPPPLINNYLGMTYAPVALVFGILMLIVGVLLEIFIPFKKDVAKYGGPLAQEYPNLLINWPAWPPILAGIITGLTQVPMRMVGKMGLGGSGSMVTAVSTLTCGWLFPNQTICDNAYQILFNYAWVIIGALLASFSGGTKDLNFANMPSEPLTDGFAWWRMALGMFLCMFGSLYAGGCTCGHGVTGMSELNVESWVGGCTIFAAAIATRFLMVYVGGVVY